MAIHLSSDEFKKLYELANSVAARNGCELYDIELAGGGQILRVFIDKAGGVGIDECADVSNGLNLQLDVENLGTGSRYDLEVSSPGLERILKEPRHYRGAVGSYIRLTRTYEVAAKPEMQKETFEGLLLNANDEGIEVRKDGPSGEPDGKTEMIPWKALEKGRTVFRIEKKRLPGKGPRMKKQMETNQDIKMES